MTSAWTDMVAKVEPVIRQSASDAEANRRLSPETIRAIIDAGIMKSLVPKAYGGLEMEPVEAMKMVEHIARIDSAAGWIVGNSCGISTMGMMYPAEANQEKYRDTNVMVAGAWFRRERPNQYKVATESMLTGHSAASDQ